MRMPRPPRLGGLPAAWAGAQWRQPGGTGVDRSRVLPSLEREPAARRTTPAATRSEQRVRPEAPHAVVIGAGLGGLAAAIRLSVRGYRVTVLDRLDQPGGRARVHRIDGFTFDAGPTVVTAPFLFEELWQLCGRRFEDDIDLRPVTPFYRIRFDDGAVFDYTGSAEAMAREVARFSPRDVAGYEAFLRKSEAIFRVGFEQLAHVPFGSPLDMVRIAPEMVRLESFRTVYGLVARHVRDERLRQVLSFHPLLVGGNPFVGHVDLLADRLSRAPLRRALPDGRDGPPGRRGWCACSSRGRRRCGSAKRCARSWCGTAPRRACASRRGERVAADVVVSNADAAFTYRQLVPEHARRRWTDRRLERARYSMWLFVWYFGTDRRYEDVAHHTILLGPRYRGLLDDIFERKGLAEDFSLYLHRPTATDPSLAPEGCDAFYVLSPVPHLESGIDWDATAASYRRRHRSRISRHRPARP